MRTKVLVPVEVEFFEGAVVGFVKPDLVDCENAHMASIDFNQSCIDNIVNA